MWILKSDYKIQTIVLSVMFVVVGMVLVSAITEKALATIQARAITHVGSFSDISGHMFVGIFLLPPILTPIEKDIIWKTTGPGVFGNERGYVVANVGVGEVKGKVTFYFNNPARGSNTCEVVPKGVATCDITQGVHARALYQVFSIPSLPHANGGDANSDDEDDNSDDTP